MKRNVLVLEINEITWNLIDPLIEAGKLPTFARLKSEGAWAAPLSVDLPPQLDPWITWTTVHTGRTQAEHNVYHLQQPPETIHAPRLWEICDDAGLKVGVYGSLCSYPPQKVDGFYVPDTFSPDVETFPANLSPIQRLNLTYTRSARLPDDKDGLLFKAKLGSDLLRLGLSLTTCRKILQQLAKEKINPEIRWQRAALQPEVNFDFFTNLYRKYRPDFATFHTNHVAHYQHTYWKAMQPDAFQQPTTEDEKRIYGEAIEFGYGSADNLLNRALSLCDENTVLIVASSMGQKPYISSLDKGKQIGQLRSLERLAEILDVNNKAKFLSVMSDQFNIYPNDDSTKQSVQQNLSKVYVDSPDCPMFHVNELEDFLTVTLGHYDKIDENSRCYFPHQDKNFLYSDLVYETGMIKSGCHDPEGMLILYGNGIRHCHITDSTNLDIAPTVLSLLSTSVPPEMKGNVLSEAFDF